MTAGMAPVVAPATGRLGVLLVGLGAVATTTMAGVFAIRRGLAQPIGSLTQMGTVRLGRRDEGRTPAIKDFVPLAGFDDLVFGGLPGRELRDVRLDCWHPAGRDRRQRC